MKILLCSQKHMLVGTINCESTSNKAKHACMHACVRLNGESPCNMTLSFPKPTEHYIEQTFSQSISSLVLHISLVRYTTPTTTPTLLNHVLLSSMATSLIERHHFNYSKEL